MRATVRLLLAGVCVCVVGCAQRSLTITSDPPGALVFLNGPDEVGRTPLKCDFQHYGDFEVVLRKDGYETLKTHRNLKAPWTAFPPFDLFAEAFGSKDHQEWHFALNPVSQGGADPQTLIGRANELKGELRSTQYTRAATMPSTVPATAPATRSADAATTAPPP